VIHVRALAPRDRNLLVYVLWPAALLASLIWIVGPLAVGLADARRAVADRQNELAAMHAASARAGSVAAVLQPLQSQAAALRRKVITPRQSVDAVVSLQRMLREAGNRVMTVRVGELERPRRAESAAPAPGGAAEPAVTLARIPIDVSARGSYATLTRFLRQWALGTVPLKLTKVAASGTEEGDLEISLSAAALVQAQAETR
jgi:hypothetical protein